MGYLQGLKPSHLTKEGSFGIWAHMLRQEEREISLLILSWFARIDSHMTISKTENSLDVTIAEGGLAHHGLSGNV